MAASLLAVAVTVCGCGASSSDASNADTSRDAASSDAAGCVDFVVGSADLSCSAATDCAFINALHVCPHDPFCGGEIAVNNAGLTRYRSAIAAIPLDTSGSCGAPLPVACVANQCVVSR